MLFAHRKELMELKEQIGTLHKTASGYLYAAGSLLGQLQSIAEESTDPRKVLRLAESVAAREFTGTAKPGTERVRFVSGITDQGMMLFEDTIAALAPRLYILDDSWGAASALMLSALRRFALESGQDVITCACPLFPYTKIDHLLLPELGLGFVTRNKLHPISLAGERVIHARRFTDLEQLNGRKHRIRFLTKAAQSMLEQASALLGEAKHVHDLLEQRYIAAMDFSKVDRHTGELIERFLTLAKSDML